MVQSFHIYLNKTKLCLRGEAQFFAKPLCSNSTELQHQKYLNGVFEDATVLILYEKL